jgi:predicted DNA-binding transcriptional regulator YafY
VKDARPYAAADYQRLKAATVGALRVTPEENARAFAVYTRCEPRTLQKFCDHESDLFAPIDVIADIESRAAQPVVTRVLADLAGYKLTPLRFDEAAAPLAAIKEMAEASAAIAGMMLAGDVGRDTAKVVLKELEDAETAIAAAIAALKKRVGKK